MPADAPTSCPACSRLSRGRADNYASDPFFIAELRETVAVLHNHQGLRGWTVLLLKDHVEHLSALPFARQASIFEDVARMTAAVRSVCTPRRINYECLGNVMPHVHWHIVPRYEAPVDPDPLKPVWIFGQTFLECGADPTTVKRLATQLRTELPT